MPRTVEELMKTDETLPRNPVLAKFFRLAKLCESAGYGFDKMLEWKKQTGNDVTFETNVYKTKFTFMIDTTKVIGKESDMEDVAKNVVKDVVSNLTDRQRIILNLMSDLPSITAEKMSQRLSVAQRTIQRDIQLLTKLGIVIREGGRFDGKWVIVG